MVVVISMDEFQSYEFEPMKEFVPCIPGIFYQIKWGGGVTRSVSYKNKHVIQFPGISLKSKNGRIA